MKAIRMSVLLDVLESFILTVCSTTSSKGKNFGRLPSLFFLSSRFFLLRSQTILSRKKR